VWENPISIKHFEPALQVLTLADKFAVAGIPIGSDRMEADSEILHFTPVILGGSNGDLVAATLEFESQRKTGMEIAT